MVVVEGMEFNDQCVGQSLYVQRYRFTITLTKIYYQPKPKLAPGEAAQTAEKLLTGVVDEVTK